jgi:cell division protein FtsW (lipid II flippase)
MADMDVVVFGLELDNNTSGYRHVIENATNTTQIKNVADVEWNAQARIVALWVQIVIGSIGGFCACAWLWVIRRRKSRVNVILLHVTIADLLVMLATLVQVTWEMADRWWLLGDVMCRIVKFFQSFTMMASSNMLVLLSIDRHQAIRSPLRNPVQVSVLYIKYPI